MVPNCWPLSETEKSTVIENNKKEVRYKFTTEHCSFISLFTLQIFIGHICQ